jgi:hypothetical protein
MYILRKLGGVEIRYSRTQVAGAVKYNKDEHKQTEVTLAVSLK